MKIFLWSMSFFIAAAFFGPVSGQADEFPAPVNTEKATTSPMAPEEVVRTARLPEGFELRLIAAEPQIQNPIAMTMDHRGRLWVAENYSWSGNNEGGFNPQQRDRIVILEDTDGDGIHDKRIVFWDDARMLTSIEVGHGGVWAISLPNLIFIPDADRDDRPDAAPRIVLDGLGAGIKNHTPANGLKWGPDGWLYGRQGILSDSSIGKPGAPQEQRFNMNTGIWRYHPVQDRSEAVMHGMTNSWGFDFDEHGEIFVINTVIGHLWHVIPGGHTERMFGVDINPYSFKLLPQVADHVHWNTGERWSDIRHGVSDSTSAAGGGHAHIGLMIYQGDNWPAEYRNKAYTLNLHGQRINSDILRREGAGYTASHGPDFCFIADPWYRGMELLNGPDGSVYIADWSDTGECHDHDGVHRTSGRIYQLRYGPPTESNAFDLSKLLSRELIALHFVDNVWWSRQARTLLCDRIAHDLSAPDAEALRSQLREKYQSLTVPLHRQRLLSTIGAVGGTPTKWWLSQLNSASEYERVTALKFLLEQELPQSDSCSPVLLKQLIQLAGSDPSGLVQLHLASAMQQLPVENRWQIAEPLADRKEFAQDRFLPLMIWYGIEPAILKNPSRAISLIQSSQMPQLNELITRRLTMEMERHPNLVDHLLEIAISGKTVSPESLIQGISQALAGWLKAPAPENWTKVVEKFGKSENQIIREQVQNLSLLFGDGRAMDEVRALIVDKDQAVEVRKTALKSLLATQPKDYVPTLLNLMKENPLAAEAVRGLSQYDDPSIPEAILAHAGAFTPEARAEMIQTLSSRPASAKFLLGAVKSGKINAAEISAFHARQIASYEVPELTKDLTDLWGNVRVSAAEKRQQMEHVKAKLTPEVLAEANLPAGRALFQKTCASCHVLYGAGRKLGPDLTGSNRKILDYLLENIVDPSASVGAAFRTVAIVLEDGRVINGVVSESTDRTITLLSAQETYTIDRQQIDEMKTTDVSLMPEGQLQNLSEEQIRDLFAYLMSSEQVELPQE